MARTATLIFCLFLHFVLALSMLSDWTLISSPSVVLYREPIVFAAVEPGCDLTISAQDTRTGTFSETLVVTLNSMRRYMSAVVDGP